ncbi:MAG: winged helix-turn-helix transcriptional regulator [Bacteroidaceae bacterium]|nr:winged helix-turn-helix transcriptional regulator [Bacteroidaceae bacterium]
MNKCLYVIGIVLALLLFPYCSGELAQRPEGLGNSAHAALAGIDSMMWRQPDSAFAVLQGFVVGPEVETLDTFDWHYCQVLISELLYKNYKQQSNRNDLLRAVDFFDSLTANTHGMSSQERNAFLDARAHYINGVGFYEQGNVVQACSEYLKALEVMEGHFDEKALIGKRAVFMFYTYNRLLSLFSAQFMMDPAISCGEQALVCCQNAPSLLSKEIPNTYFHIGKQYDKKGEKDVARKYYELAIEGLSDINNPVYRDVVSTKALSDYQAGLGADASLIAIKKVLPSVNNEKEKLTRFLTIGVIFTLEQSFDSALYYLIPVFENEDDVFLQIQAADYLLINYNNLGDKEKSEECMRFLANHKKTEGETKALVSKLEGMFKAYMNQKQEKEAEEAREKSIRETIEIVVFITALFILAILVTAKQKSKQLLRKQQEATDKVLEETEQEHEKELRLWQAEADKTLEETEKKHEEELETERLAHQKKQEALQQNLQEREAHVNVLEKALNQQRKEAEQRRMAFLKEPICEAILNKAKSKQITTRDVAHELGIALKDEDLERLGEAVAKHYDGFDHVLLSQCPSLKHGYLALCHLHLLGLSESEIAALKNVSYSAIRKQNENLQEKLGVDENISAYVLRIAEGLCGTPDVEQENQIDMDLQRTKEKNPGHSEETEQKSSLKSSLKSSQKILELISASPSITISEIADRLGMTKRGVDKNIKRLKEQGVIRRVGPDKGGHWEVIE